MQRWVNIDNYNRFIKVIVIHTSMSLRSKLNEFNTEPREKRVIATSISGCETVHASSNAKRVFMSYIRIKLIIPSILPR